MPKLQKHSAAYFDGILGFRTRQVCRYTEQGDKDDWADGFASALAEEGASKVWYRSKTFQAALICLGVGLLIVAFGRIGGFANGTGNMMMSAGGGMTLGSVLSMFLRVALQGNSPLTFGNYPSYPQ
ncbi:hypothetical protein M0R72_12795 [Candidatus Pacearchaeota archaeon]|jgi:ribosome modulation factor|nr:hypothetical protein [Candidatus Pacearchaeota archaeon]